MSISRLSLLAVLAHVTLGNVCMMPMASAAMPDAMNMTHVAMSDHAAPLSSAVEKESNAMDCSTGACMMTASVDDSANPDVPHPIATATSAISGIIVATDTDSFFLQYHSTAPPGLSTYTETIVLRY